MSLFSHLSGKQPDSTTPEKRGPPHLSDGVARHSPPRLNIYMLTSNEVQIGMYDACVVYAASPEDAVTIGPDKPPDWAMPGDRPVWATDKGNVHCRLIGEAEANSERGVVLASYIAE